MRWTLHECGVTLHGPSPRTLLGPIPVETMWAAAGRDMAQAVEGWERHRTWDAWSQRYAVVTMARMLRTRVLGDVVSKPAAVAVAEPAQPILLGGQVLVVGGGDCRIRQVARSSPTSRGEAGPGEGSLGCRRRPRPLTNPSAPTRA